MRKMKTLILGDGMEMGCFADVTVETATSILKVNPEDACSLTLQNARNTPYFSTASTPKISNTIIVKIKNRRVSFMPKTHSKMGVHF
jgi:hypothetical protein